MASRREKESFRVRERRDYIANNRTLVKSNIQTALYDLSEIYLILRLRVSRRQPFYPGITGDCIGATDLTISGGAEF